MINHNPCLCCSLILILLGHGIGGIVAEKENGAFGHVNKYGTEKLELSLPQALNYILCLMCTAFYTSN